MITPLIRRYQIILLDSSSNSEYIINLDAASSLTTNVSYFPEDILEFFPEVADFKIARWSENSEGSGDLDSSGEEARFRNAKILRKGLCPEGIAIRKKLLADAKKSVEARAYRPKK